MEIVALARHHKVIQRGVARLGIAWRDQHHVARLGCEALGAKFAAAAEDIDEAIITGRYLALEAFANIRHGCLEGEDGNKVLGGTCHVAKFS